MDQQSCSWAYTQENTQMFILFLFKKKKSCTRMFKATFFIAAKTTGNHSMYIGWRTVVTSKGVSKDYKMDTEVYSHDPSTPEAGGLWVWTSLSYTRQDHIPKQTKIMLTHYYINESSKQPFIEMKEDTQGHVLHDSLWNVQERQKDWRLTREKRKWGYKQLLGFFLEW